MNDVFQWVVIVILWAAVCGLSYKIDKLNRGENYHE